MTPEWELQWDALTKVLSENGQGCIIVQVNGLERARELASRIKKNTENSSLNSTIIEFDSNSVIPQEIVKRINESTNGWKDDNGVVVLVSTAPVLDPQRVAFWKNMNFARERFGAFAFHIVFMLSPDEYTVFLTEADHFADWCMLRVDLTVRVGAMEKVFRIDEPGVDPRQARIALENLEPLLLHDNEIGVDEKKLIERYYLPMFFLAADAQDYKRADILRRKIRDDDVPERLNRKWIMYNVDIAVKSGMYTGIHEKCKRYISNVMRKKNVTVDDLMFAGKLAHVTADYRIAVDFYEQAIECQLVNSGEKDPVIGELYNYLGASYYELGEFKKAIELYSQSLLICKEIYGEQHPNTAETYNNLGALYSKIGRYQESIVFLEKALAIHKKNYSEQHPNVAKTLNNIGLTYKYLHDYQNAITMCENALEINITVYGVKHPAVATNYINIASIYSGLGEYQRAIEYLEKSFVIFKKFYGKKHQDTRIVQTTIENIKMKIQSKDIQEI